MLYILKETFEYFLQYINLRHIIKYGLTVPDPFRGQVDAGLLKKIQEYTVEKTRFGFITSAFGNLVTIFFFFGGLLNIYNSWISALDLNFMMHGITFFLLLGYASTIISVPFNLYSTFRIENKYGFNTMTPRLWIFDFMKTLLLSTILIVLVAGIALWIIQASPSFWWIYVWGFFLIFSLFMMYISPYVIEPLFNTFIPIEEEGLEEEIKAHMAKADIKVSRVFKMDASKRSRHTNAYFSGIGKVKRIVLYDTLLEIMNHDEIVAVVAHEAGHWKKKHIVKMLIGVEAISFISIYVAFRILQTNFLTDMFRISADTFFAKVVILGFIGSILSFPFVPLNSYISRRFEKEADRFSCELTGKKEAMASSLVKLSKDNLANIHPHPAYATFYYSHPPIVQRIRDIQEMSLE